MSNTISATPADRVVLAAIAIDEKNQIQFAANPYGGWHLEIRRWWRRSSDDAWKPGPKQSGFAFRDRALETAKQVIAEFEAMEKPEQPKPGENPRAKGVNARAKGTNPRAKGTNPKAQRRQAA